jgi:formylglycine-generating enzyme required for sulfatase activity
MNFRILPGPLYVIIRAVVKSDFLPENRRAGSLDGPFKPNGLFVFRWLILLFFLSSCQQSPPRMVWIPAGEFVMGTDQKDEQQRSEDLGIIKPWFEDEHPAHRVFVQGFYMDRLEVTNGDYAAYLKATQAPPPPSFPPDVDSADLPVTDIDWFQADTYCRWAGKRLPAEAEWEKAARGPDGRIFPWGDEYSVDKANILGKALAPVGSYPQGRSPYGIDDLLGNVWEWTSDWYGPYPGNSYRSDKFGTGYKVIRGKSWTTAFGHQSMPEIQEITRHESRAGYRLLFDPDYHFSDLGFRCAKSP